MTVAEPKQRARYTRHALKCLRTARAAATPDQIERGTAWYPIARSIAADLGRYCARGDLASGAGILAALSPQTSWEANVLNAEDFARTGHLVSAAGYFECQLGKAGAIRDGAAPLDILRGPKETDFYLSIIGEPARPCIDRHMVTAAGVERFGSLTPARYALVSEACATVAAEHGEDPHTTQAIIWTVQRDATTTTNKEMPF